MFDRRIRSYCMRNAGLSAAQQQVLDNARQAGILSTKSQREWVMPDQEMVLDIGFGKGESLLYLARSAEASIGIEVFTSGIAHVLKVVEDEGLSGVRIFQGDAYEFMTQCPSASLRRVQLYFPDPWPKKRHGKRRLIQPEFLPLLHRVLKPQGHFHFVTDWQPYAEHAQDCFAQSRAFISSTSMPVWRQERPQTRYEKKALLAGRHIHDFLWQKSADA